MTLTRPRHLLAALLVLAAPALSQAEGERYPLLKKGFTPMQVPAGIDIEIDLERYFSTTEVTDVVRFSTTLGDIYVGLFGEDVPRTAQNFKNYVIDGDYDSSIIHRSVPLFVIQGGGFRFPDAMADDVVPVEVDDSIENEFKFSNVRGTLSMAKMGGNPDSATSQWFINLEDNGPGSSANLDGQNGGFSVFAGVVKGMDVVDQIEALETAELNDGWGGNVPLFDTDFSGKPDRADYVEFSSVDIVPFPEDTDTSATEFAYSIELSNEALAPGRIEGNKLYATFNPEAAGKVVGFKVTARLGDDLLVREIFAFQVVEDTSAYVDWLYAQFSFDAISHLEGVAVGHDPDDDGVSNLEEFYFGLDPHAPDLVGIDYSVTDEGKLRITYVADAAVADAVEVRVQRVNVAGEWGLYEHEVVPFGGNDLSGEKTVILEIDPDLEPEHLVVRLVLTLAQ